MALRVWGAVMGTPCWGAGTGGGHGGGPATLVLGNRHSRLRRAGSLLSGPRGAGAPACVTPVLVPGEQGALDASPPDAAPASPSQAEPSTLPST